MSRSHYRLVNAKVRANAIGAVHSAPEGSEVTISEPRRNLDQNAAFWAAMTELSNRIPFAGEKRSAEDWRTLILSGWFKATGRTVAIMPGLEGEPVALGRSSARLSKAEMSEVLDYAHARLAQMEAA